MEDAGPLAVREVEGLGEGGAVRGRGVSTAGPLPGNRTMGAYVDLFAGWRGDGGSSTSALLSTHKRKER